jgi:hypothetical protein
VGTVVKERQITEFERRWLLDLTRRLGSPLGGAVQKLGVTQLSEAERQGLREVLATELCKAGLLDTGEPNDHGEQIEALIDKLAAL